MLLSPFCDKHRATGRWSPSEDDILVKRVMQAQQAAVTVPWETIGTELNRLPSSVWNRWHNVCDSAIKKGKWLQIVDEVVLQQVIKMEDPNIAWEVMGRKIGRPAIRFNTGGDRTSSPACKKGVVGVQRKMRLWPDE